MTRISDHLSPMLCGIVIHSLVVLFSWWYMTRYDVDMALWPCLKLYTNRLVFSRIDNLMTSLESEREHELDQRYGP